MAIQNFNTKVAFKQVEETTIDDSIKVLVKDETTGEVKEVLKTSFGGGTPTLNDVLTAGNTTTNPLKFFSPMFGGEEMFTLTPEGEIIATPFSMDSGIVTGFQGVHEDTYAFQVGINPNGAQMTASTTDNSSTAQLHVNTDGMFYSALGVEPRKGIRYNEDYSAYYVDRSLVDKAYVDNAIASSEGSDSVNYGDYGQIPISSEDGFLYSNNFTYLPDLNRFRIDGGGGWAQLTPERLNMNPGTGSDASYWSNGININDYNQSFEASLVNSGLSMRNYETGGRQMQFFLQDSNPNF